MVEDYVNKLSKNPDVLVQVDAFKWNWQFEYQSAKDASGQTDATPPATDQTTGEKNSPLYLSTVGSANEIPVLVLPLGKTVQVIEHSEDVIHSFWVPEFLFKRDVIPYGTPAEQKAERAARQPLRVHADLDGQLRRALRRAVRHLPLADELRGPRRPAGRVRSVPGRAEADRPGRRRRGRPRR